MSKKKCAVLPTYQQSCAQRDHVFPMELDEESAYLLVRFLFERESEFQLLVM